MTTTTYRLLDAVADSFNPLLTVVALGLPLWLRPRNLRSTIAYYLSTGAAVGVVYLVRAIDNRYQIWMSLGLDFSTHSAFAASLVSSMGAFQRRWLVALVFAALGYFSLELVMRYHGLVDILSSALMAAMSALLIHSAVVRVVRFPTAQSAPPSGNTPGR